MIIHTRQYLVTLLFADLPSLSPSFHEMTFILVIIILTLCGRLVIYKSIEHKSGTI